MNHASRPVVLILEPTNSTFQTKRIELGETPVKVGRKASPKVQALPENGIFESKVLSRSHAEIWSEGGRIYIKDVGSSNGTFVNNTRLSDEGATSTPKELHNGDYLDFGIDIANEDGTTILYKKVSARVRIDSTADITTMPADMQKFSTLLDENINRAYSACEQLERLNLALDSIEEFVVANPPTTPPAVQMELEESQRSLRRAEERALRAERERAAEKAEVETLRQRVDALSNELRTKEEAWTAEKQQIEQKAKETPPPPPVKPPLGGAPEEKGSTWSLDEPNELPGNLESPTTPKKTAQGNRLAKDVGAMPAFIQVSVGILVTLLVQHMWAAITGSTVR